MNTNVIYNCDVFDGFKKLPDETIDLVVTSPPYNCGIEYDSWQDSKPWDEYLSWCEDWIKEIKRVLKPDGRFAINHLVEMGIPANGKKNGLRVSPQVELHKIINKVGLNIAAQTMWADPTKSTLTCWGSWQSASAPYIYNPYEVVLIGYKDQWKKQRDKNNPGINTISRDDFMVGVGGVWELQPEVRGLTLANFPVSLPKLCIELLTFKDEIVLDPFMGSGTTAIACLLTDRKYIGFEISENYHKISDDRIENFKINGETVPSVKKMKKQSSKKETKLNPLFEEE